jgi:hypothetical protein
MKTANSFVINLKPRNNVHSCGMDQPDAVTVKWRNLVNTAMNLQIPQEREISLLAERPLDF